MRVLLFSDFPVAIPYLEPVGSYLKSLGVDVVFGGDAKSKEIVSQLGYEWVDGPEYEYDWAICSDKLSVCPQKNRIVVFHGFSSKGQDYCKRIGISKREVAPSDISVVPSKYAKYLYTTKDGADPDKVIVGGLTKLDKITELLPKNDIPKILYAPTHNPQLSAIPVIKDRIYELDNLKVHLHHYTKHGTMPHHAPMLAYHHTHTEEDITKLMLEADIVISDFGSLIIEAIGLGKMGIQVRNPLYEAYYKERVGEDISEIPEIAIPNEFGYAVDDMDSIIEAIKEYPSHKTFDPRFPIIENIGNYKVSKIIYEIIN